LVALRQPQGGLCANRWAVSIVEEESIMDRLLVIGGASSDVLHLEDRTVACAGGAGMYTAMAARRCGAQVALFGPRPDPCPDNLKPVSMNLSEWLGPVISPAQLLQFEISYRGGETKYLKASVDAETLLSTSMLPADLSKYDLVHLTPLGDAEKQLSFIQACRHRGAKRISAGTWPRDAVERPQAVRAVMEQADYFFMNDLEAKAVFGSLESASIQPGKVLYITLGAQGACIIQGETSSLIPAVLATELDPTGAGDTFCGATLAYLLRKAHPIMAARHATTLAAEMITQVGPTALLSDDPPPKVPLDERVRVNDELALEVAEKISTLPQVSPFPFVSPELIPVGHPKALDYFFVETVQQFSFWSEKNNRYNQPLIAEIGGVEHKGSDYLYEAFRRRVEQDANFCSPERQANLSRGELLEVFRADNGDSPMPALDLHLEQARYYGRDMLGLQLTPQAVLHKALASDQPLQTLMAVLDQIGGYKEDPLRKKSSLLALALTQRPERFLPLREDEQVAPVIDYHALRSCLRIGLIDVIDERLRSKLANRQIVSPTEEWAVRYPAYRAIEQVVALSGKSTGAMDSFFFGARKRCPEMSEPECQFCEVDQMCAHRKELFQPVLRTTFY
jgi:sugar/nucleoside kinase (ribokinase family)